MICYDYSRNKLKPCVYFKKKLPQEAQKLTGSTPLKTNKQTNKQTNKKNKRKRNKQTQSKIETKKKKQPKT